MRRGTPCGGFFPRALLPTLLLLIGAAGGCRDALMDDEPWTPDVDDFDAGIDDDAGPGELCPPGTESPFNNAHSYYMGGEESVDLVVVNVSYFRCPYCADFASLSHDLWASRDDFRGRVRLYYNHFPFDNETAWRLHACSEAAGRQGAEHFWAVHDFLYDGMKESKLHSVEDVVAFVDEELGLDMARFNADRESGEVMSLLAWQKSQAQAAGVTGTPAVFVCGERVSWNNIESAVNGYLYP